MKKALILIVMSGLILSACQRAETTDDIDRKAVERWQALIAGDYETAYSYIAPSYQELETIDVYKNRLATAQLQITWKEVTFKNKSCQEDICKVRLNMKYLYRFPQRGMGEVIAETEIKEDWIMSNDKWYFMPGEKKDI